MRTHQRILIGGLGALAPIILFLATADSERLFAGQFETAKVLGYVVRASALFLIGGFIAYLHKDEKSPIKILQFGCAAPALIAGFISSSAPANVSASNPLVPRAAIGIQFIAAAQAQPVTPASTTRPASYAPKQYSLPEQTTAEQFFQGLTGRGPKNVWYVIVGSHLKVDTAQKQAESINRKFPGFKAEVYAPLSETNPYYAVVIGAQLTQDDAKALRDNAVKAGLPKDTYYKIPERLPSKAP